MQFTLRQMFACTAYCAAAFWLMGIVVDTWRTFPTPASLLSGLVVGFGPVIAGALMGAGIGHLFGDMKSGAIRGVVAAVVVLLIWVAVSVVWFVPRP